MTQPKYKLTYFNGRGRAEISRMIFAAAGVEYEDVRVDREAWMKLKPNAPFGQLPMLEVEGVSLCQSNTIARYLANEFGLVGKTALDKARCDMIVDCGEDFAKPFVQMKFENDEAKKVEMKEKLEEEQAPTMLGKLEKLLMTNNEGDSYFVGDQLTWSDIAMAEMLTVPDRVGLQVAIDWDKYPKLRAFKDRVRSTPKIAEWIEKRPDTPF